MYSARDGSIKTTSPSKKGGSSSSFGRGPLVSLPSDQPVRIFDGRGKFALPNVLTLPQLHRDMGKGDIALVFFTVSFYKAPGDPDAPEHTTLNVHFAVKLADAANAYQPPSDSDPEEDEKDPVTHDRGVDDFKTEY